MLRSIDFSRAGMLRQQQYLDATAHNIANATTPGFRAVRAALETGDVAPTDANATADETPATPPLGARVNLTRLFTQGTVRDTGAATDMAITGEGFFTVRLPDGTNAYTRNGSFRLDADGRLSDTAGRLVQPGITVPAGASDLRVGEDGGVSVQLVDGTRQRVGQIQLARFTNPNGLLAGTDGLFTATIASGAPQTSAPGQNGAGRVRAGALEDANADITEQMSNIVAAQRAYQLNTSAFRMADDMLRIAGQIGGGG